jgi:hypothetical protein
MLNDLRDQLPLPSLAGEKFRQSITAEMSRIRNGPTPDGGLGYWEGHNSADVYLSSTRTYFVARCPRFRSR